MTETMHYSKLKVLFKNVKRPTCDVTLHYIVIGEKFVVNVEPYNFNAEFPLNMLFGSLVQENAFRRKKVVGSTYLYDWSPSGSANLTFATIGKYRCRGFGVILNEINGEKFPLKPGEIIDAFDAITFRESCTFRFSGAFM